MGVEPTSTGLQPVAVPSGSSVVVARRGSGLCFILSLKVVVAVDAIKSGLTFRQHFLNRLPLPQGQGSLRPSFSSSSLSP